VSGLASSFGLGTTTRSASATDLAGNSATTSMSFTVVVTPPDVGPIVNPANGHSYYLLAAEPRENRADVSGTSPRIGATVHPPVVETGGQRWRALGSLVFETHARHGSSCALVDGGD
jgi:hypothetical protein